LGKPKGHTGLYGNKKIVGDSGSLLIILATQETDKEDCGSKPATSKSLLYPVSTNKKC
jgi:hypothetical protein